MRPPFPEASPLPLHLFLIVLLMMRPLNTHTSPHERRNTFTPYGPLAPRKNRLLDPCSLSTNPRTQRYIPLECYWCTRFTRCDNRTVPPMTEILGPARSILHYTTRVPPNGLFLLATRHGRWIPRLTDPMTRLFTIYTRSLKFTMTPRYVPDGWMDILALFLSSSR